MSALRKSGDQLTEELASNLAQFKYALGTDATDVAETIDELIKERFVEMLEKVTKRKRVKA